MRRFSYGFCSPAVLTSRTTGVYMKSHARQKSKNALKRRSNFNPPSFCISAPSGSRRRPRNRRSVARFFIARPAGTPLALKESAGCLEITFSRGLCQPRPNSTFFLIRGEPHSYISAGQCAFFRTHTPHWTSGTRRGFPEFLRTDSFSS